MAKLKRPNRGDESNGHGNDILVMINTSGYRGSLGKCSLDDPTVALSHTVNSDVVLLHLFQNFTWYSFNVSDYYPVLKKTTTRNGKDTYTRIGTGTVEGRMSTCPQYIRGKEQPYQYFQDTILGKRLAEESNELSFANWKSGSRGPSRVSRRSTLRRRFQCE
jgi:hypothetical protein